MKIASHFALLLVGSLTAMAQSERGNITGIATDPSGAAVATGGFLGFVKINPVILS